MALEAYPDRVQRLAVESHLAFYIAVGVGVDVLYVLVIQGNFNLVHHQSVEELVAIIGPGRGRLYVRVRQVCNLGHSGVRGGLSAEIGRAHV